MILIESLNDLDAIRQGTGQTLFPVIDQKCLAGVLKFQYRENAQFLKALPLRVIEKFQGHQVAEKNPIALLAQGQQRARQVRPYSLF